jgi:hypothetical protein
VGIYFRTDTTRCSFRELRRIHPRFDVFLAACFMKAFGLRQSARTVMLHEEVIRVIPEESVPTAGMRAMGTVIEEFRRSGATLAFYHAVSGVGPMRGFAAVLLPPERDAVISVTWTSPQASRGGKAGRAIVSELRGGTFLATGGGGPRFDPPPGFEVFRYPDASPAELMRRHRLHLEQNAATALPVEDAEQAERAVLAMKRRNWDWNVGRGVWVPLSEEELVSLGLPVGD